MINTLLGYWWVPVIIIFYAVWAFTSVKTNQGNTVAFFLSWAFGIVPLWTVISKYSRNLIFDGVLYDVIQIITFAIVMMYATNSFNELSWRKLCGIAMSIGGLIIFKVVK